MGRDISVDEEELEAKRLMIAGLSNFERCALAFLVDDEIRRPNENDEKIKIELPSASEREGSTDGSL